MSLLNPCYESSFQFLNYLTFHFLIVTTSAKGISLLIKFSVLVATVCFASVGVVGYSILLMCKFLWMNTANIDADMF